MSDVKIDGWIALTPNQQKAIEKKFNVKAEKLVFLGDQIKLTGPGEESDVEGQECSWIERMVWPACDVADDLQNDLDNL